MAFPTGWTKRFPLTIDNTKVSGAGDLTNFPVYLSGANIPAAYFTAAAARREINANWLLSDANLQGYWRLESDGTDSGPNGYTLTGSGTPTHTTGKFGNGADLESTSSQRYSIADASCANLEISGSQTWSAWVKFESTAASMRIMAKRDTAGVSHQISLGGSSLIGVLFSGLTTNAFVESAVVPTAGTWYHVVGIYDSAASKIKIWVNGKKWEATASGTTSDTNADFAIGCDFTGASDTAANFLDGVVDDCAILNRALSDAEVIALYTGTANLRFSSDSAGATQIAHEVVSGDPDASTMEIHVKVPTVDYDNDTVFYAWYDPVTQQSPQAVGDTYGSQAVWSDYEAVYHCRDAGYTDSSANGYNLGPGTAPALSTSGKVGGGYDFEATSSQYLTLADASCANLEIAGSQTWQTWINLESHKAQRILSKSNSADHIIYMGASTSGYTSHFLLSGLTTNFFVRDDSLELSLATWYMLHARYDSAATTLAILRNGGNKVSVTASGSASDTNGDFRLGANNTPGDYFDGLMDEIRIRDSALSDDWIATEYANQNDPATFVTEGAVVDTTSIKTILGLSYGSVSLVNGLAVASIKDIGGLA